MMIRLLTVKDCSHFRILRLEALQESPAFFAASYAEESALSAPAFKKKFLKCTFFGAFDHQQLVGCIGFKIHPASKMRHKGMIFGAYIQAAYREQGLGDALLEAVVAYAKAHVLQVQLMVATINQNAVHLYQKHGFRIYGTEERSLKIGEIFYDEHLMVRLF